MTETVYHYHKLDRSIVDVVLLCAALFLVFWASNHLEGPDIPALMAAGVFTLGSLRRILRPNRWELNITPNGVYWVQPKSSGNSKAILFSEIERVFFSTEENSILLCGSKGRSYAVPRRCFARLNEVIDAIRTANPKLELHGE